MGNLGSNRCGRKIARSWFKAATLCIFAATSLHGQTKAPDPHQTLLNQFSDSMDELTARVSPAVVQVRVTGYRAVEDKD